jgi:hypothetical protein
MSDQPPIFKVRVGKPGFGWVVDIFWPSEPVEEIKGFATEKDATDWIAKVSKRLTEEE